MNFNNICKQKPIDFPMTYGEVLFIRVCQNMPILGSTKSLETKKALLLSQNVIWEDVQLYEAMNMY